MYVCCHLKINVVPERMKTTGIEVLGEIYVDNKLELIVGCRSFFRTISIKLIMYCRVVRRWRRDVRIVFPTKYAWSVGTYIHCDVGVFLSVLMHFICVIQKNRKTSTLSFRFWKKRRQCTDTLSCGKYGTMLLIWKKKYFNKIGWITYWKFIFEKFWSRFLRCTTTHVPWYLGENPEADQGSSYWHSV